MFANGFAEKYERRLIVDGQKVQPIGDGQTRNALRVLEQLGLDGEHVLVEEAADAAQQLGGGGGDREVHGASLASINAG